MRALIAASKSDNYPADIHLVISNNKDAEGLHIAQENNIKTIHTNKNQFEELGYSNFGRNDVYSRLAGQ